MGYHFKGKGEHKGIKANVKLFLIHFQDEQKVHFIYSPHLDLTGYGQSIGEAKNSFEMVFEDFIDYTLKKKTLTSVLTKLGWVKKGGGRMPKNLLAPSITDVIKDNKHVSDILDKYPTKTYHKEVGIPAYA